MKNVKKATPNDTYLKVIPLALILLIVPMIVFMKDVNIKGTASQFYASATQYDFFNYYKVAWFLGLTICSVIFVLFYLYVNKYQFKLNLGFIPLLVYYVFVFLSTSYSKYHDVALNGFVERYEGFWVITCYVVLCFLAAHFITYEKDIKLILGALLLCATLLCLLGLSQFFGIDFLQTDFMKKMMLPAASQSMSEQLQFKFPTRYIYLTLFNPNYVGSFCAMVLPITIVALLFARKIHTRILSGILFGLVLINTVGCRSSAGYAGIFVSIILLVILLRKRILKYWIPILALAICCTGALLYLNYSYSGIIQNELSGFLPEQKVPAESSITDISVDKNTITVYMGTTPMKIIYNTNDKTFDFFDSAGNKVKTGIDPKDKTTCFDNPKYAWMTFKVMGSVVILKAPNVTLGIQLVENNTFILLNSSAKPVKIGKPADSFGFKGYERWASSRGYIWSRSIPLLKDTIALGHGPDTFAAYFPQDDYIGKLKYLDTPYILVDKPHNMYLQMGLNTGIVSLAAFLVFILWYVISSFRLYFKPKKDTSFYYMTGSACVISVIGFLVAGIANDSNINISPIFWILLGIGFACNRLYQKELAFDSAHEIAKQKKISKK